MRDPDENQDGLYSMKVVTRLTGLSADTIRVWERRYGAVEPARTDGQTRRFSAEEVRKLVLLRQATERGHRIKSVARLGEQELLRLLEQDTSLGAMAGAEAPAGGGALQPLLTDYLAAIERFEVPRAAGLLTRAAALLERDDFLYGLVLPILRETGDRWHAGRLTVAHEHVVSAQVRDLLDSSLRLFSPQPGAPKVLVTTPPGHLHEFGAIMGALLAASRGFVPIYLGPNLPEQDLLVAVDLSHAELVLLSVIRDVDAKEQAALDASLARLAARVRVWIGLPEGHRAHGSVQGVRYFTRFEDLDAALTGAL